MVYRRHGFHARAAEITDKQVAVILDLDHVYLAVFAFPHLDLLVRHTAVADVERLYSLSGVLVLVGSHPVLVREHERADYFAFGVLVHKLLDKKGQAVTPAPVKLAVTCCAT